MKALTVYCRNLAEVLQKPNPSQICPWVKGEDLCRQLKNLKVKLQKENLCMLDLSNVDNFIFTSDKGTSKKWVKEAMGLKKINLTKI